MNTNSKVLFNLVSYNIAKILSVSFVLGFALFVMIVLYTVLTVGPAETLNALNSESPAELFSLVKAVFQSIK